MRDVNEIVICKDEYASTKEFEEAIRKAVMVLLDNNYVMTIRYDEKALGIVAIDYNPNNLEFGCDYPYWLSEDEYFSVITDEERKQMKEEEEYQ